MNLTKEKLANWDAAKTRVAGWQKQGEKVVFSNGCFDILHLGHIDYLEHARQLGQRLVVGLNTDDSVKRLKGKDRPMNNEYARARLLAALSFVDLVVSFGEDTPYSLIKHLMPNVLVKGSDYLAKDIVGADIVLNSGGEVLTIDLVEGFSTTQLIQKIKTDNS